MQRFIKGRTTQHLTWVMVDATDFATPESALSAATKIKIYGKLRANDTVQFVSSGTGSLANDIKHVGPSVLGIYTIGLTKADLSDASAAWYDQYIISLSATGAAYQVLVVDGGIDESALSAYQSRLSDLQSAVLVVQSMASDAASAAQQANSRVLLVLSNVSDVQSALTVVQSMASDAASAATQGNSRVLLVQSRLSDLDSRLASDLSDVLSGLTALSDAVSNAYSAAAQGNSRVLVVQSLVSDVDSALTSQFSDLLSLLGTTGVQLNASSLSDLRSAITGITVSVSASDISDIASAVRAIMVSDLSDILSAAVQTNSRVLVVQSMVSDVRSHVSDLQSDFQSRVPKRVATDSQASDLDSSLRALIAAGVGVSVSAMSDIASQVDELLSSRLSDILSAAQQTNSRVLVTQSMVSDVQSKLSDVESNLLSLLTTTGVQLNASTLSDIRSAIAGVTVNLTTSDISDIASAVAAAVTTITASDISDIASRVDAVLASRLSDILSAAQQANSRVLVIQSQASDVYSLVSDLQSDFQSRVPKRVATDSQLSALTSDVLSALAAGVPVSPSDMSDIRSAIIAGNLTASDISDIASAVAVRMASDLSDIYSAAQQTNSRALVNQSRVSDIYSLLSDVHSDFQSRVPKRVATDSQVSALVSDVISALAAGVPVSASDMSDIRSAIAAGTLTASAISDIASAVALQLASDLSDILSHAQQGNSRLLVAQSRTSDIYSLLSDLHSDVGVLSGVVSDVHSAIDAGVDVGPSSLSDLRSAIIANGVLRPGTEPAGVVSPTATLADKIDWQTALTRNKIEQTATVQRLKNDADDDTIASAVVSDDGTTFVRGEFA